MTSRVFFSNPLGSQLHKDDIQGTRAVQTDDQVFEFGLLISTSEPAAENSEELVGTVKGRETGKGKTQDMVAQPLFSSPRTKRPHSFRVSNTPTPLKAIASKTASSFLWRAFFNSSTGRALGKSRLLSWRT